MFSSIFGIAKDIVKVAVAPIEIAADVTRSITKPVADAVEEVVNDIKEELNDDNPSK